MKTLLFMAFAFFAILAVVSFFTRRWSRNQQQAPRPPTFTPTRHDTVVREVEGRDYE